MNLWLKKAAAYVDGIKKGYYARPVYFSDMTDWQTCATSGFKRITPRDIPAARIQYFTKDMMLILHGVKNTITEYQKVDFLKFLAMFNNIPEAYF